MKTIIPLFGVLFFFCTVASAQIQVVRSWEFNTNGQREQWTGTNHIEEVQVKDGILRGVAAGHDPFFVAEGFEFSTAPPQAVEFRYRTNSGGNGELYYASSTEGPYGGFSPKKLEHWKSNGDENWHTAGKKFTTRTPNANRFSVGTMKRIPKRSIGKSPVCVLTPLER